MSIAQLASFQVKFSNVTQIRASSQLNHFQSTVQNASFRFNLFQPLQLQEQYRQR